MRCPKPGVCRVLEGLKIALESVNIIFRTNIYKSIRVTLSFKCFGCLNVFEP